MIYLLRKCHKLKFNEKTTMPTMFITYDTETKQKLEKDGTKTHSLKLGVARFWKIKSGTITQDELVFYKKEDFWNWVESHIDQKQKCYLFAHNHQFDGQIVDLFNELPARNWHMKKEVIDNNLFIMKWQKGIHHNTKRIDGIEVTTQKGNIKTLYCLDTFNFFKTSVKAMGEKLGVPKLEIDFEKCTKEELLIYCKRDVEITEMMILSFIKFLQDNDLGNFQPTIASQAMNAYRHRFMTHEIFIHTNEDAINLERESYRGGRNEAFFIGEIKEKIYCLDFNSLYPSVMIDNLYPTKLIAFKQFNTMSSLKIDMEKYLVIAELTVTVNEPLLALRRERLIFPTGTFTGSFCGPEIQMLMERNCILKVGKVALYKGHKIFYQYVKFFYDERLKAKARKDKISDEMLKIMLNSLYGKFGQLKKENTIVGECSELEIGSHLVIDHDTKECYMTKRFAGKVIKSVSTKEESYNSFPAIASYCTAYARMELLEAIEKADWKNVFYCDTDSVFINQAGFDNLKGYVDPSKLGMLKLEYVSNGMIIKGCKDYIIFKDKEKEGITIKETKIKGVNKKSLLQSENLNSSNVYSDLLKFDKFATSLHNGKINCIVERRMSKTLTRKYSKGTKLENGKIKSIRLFEDIEIISEV